MARYASKTSVPVDRSRSEIERLLERYGASEFASGWNGTHEVIGFSYNGIPIRIRIPKAEEPQERRQRWRALKLVVNAKLESVESGIATFEEEFLAWVVTPTGMTIGDHIMPRLAHIAEAGLSPKLLPLLADD